MVTGLTEKVIVSRYSEGGDRVRQISRERAFQGLSLDLSFVTAHYV